MEFLAFCGGDKSDDVASRNDGDSYAVFHMTDALEKAPNISSGVHRIIIFFLKNYYYLFIIIFVLIDKILQILQILIGVTRSGDLRILANTKFTLKVLTSFLGAMEQHLTYEISRRFHFLVNKYFTLAATYPHMIKQR